MVVQLHGYLRLHVVTLINSPGEQFNWGNIHDIENVFAGTRQRRMHRDL